MKKSEAEEPEEPEGSILWAEGRLRLWTSGKWEVSWSDGSWFDFRPDPGFWPAYNELRDHLLEERKQQEALDEHNDKLEEAARLGQEACFKSSEHEPLEERVWRKIEMTKAGFQVCLGNLHDRLQAHDRRLTVLEGELAAVQGLVRVDGETLNIHLGKIEKLEQDFLLVRERVANVDGREAGDFEATRIHLEELDERVTTIEAVVPVEPSGETSAVVGAPQVSSVAERRFGDRLRVVFGDMGRVSARQMSEIADAIDRDAHRVDAEAEARGARVARVSASDLHGGSAQVAMHYSEWKRLVALDELWGPEGELRILLTEAATSSGPMHPDDAWRDDPGFRQLRSELLAMPKEYLFEEPAPAVVELRHEGEIRPVSVPSAYRPGTPSGEGL